MKLTARFFLALTFLAASAMPLLVFWLWPYSGILESKMHEARERNLLVARNVASVLEVYHQDLILTFDAFVKATDGTPSFEAKPIFEKMHFRHICIVDATTGVVEIAYLATEHPCPGRVPADRMQLFHTLTEGGQVRMSDVVHVPNEKPRIFIASRKGPKLVVGAIHTTFFDDLRARVRFGEGGHAAILDASGHILSHPDEARDETLDMTGIPLIQRLLAGEEGVGTFQSPVRGREMIAGFASVPGANWGVIVPQPLRELQDQANTYSADVLVIFSFGVLLSLAIAMAMGLSFSRRLKKITSALHAVAQEESVTSLNDRPRWLSIKELTSLEQDVTHLARSSASARAVTAAQNAELTQANLRLREEMEERKVAESAKRRSEIRFKSLFESAPIPIREEDLSGMKRLVDDLNIPNFQAFKDYLDAHPEFVQACARTIVVCDANQASLAEHGYADKEEMLSRVVKKLSPAAMKIVRLSLEVIHKGELGCAYETQIKRVDGTIRSVAATWSVIPGHEATYARILLCSIDITDHMKSEEALRQAQKMEAVGQLTGGVAHDFNNLLTVIGGNIDLLDAQAGLDADLIGPIRKAVHHGAELTQRLLAFSRKQPLAAQPVNLCELVAGITGLMRRSIGETVSVQIKCPDDLWPAYADPAQVETALVNLVLNARDAMPSGGTIYISCGNVALTDDDDPEVTPGDYVALSVSDSGTGMAAEVIERAFEPFFTTKEVGRGSGMGLPMVYGFAKQSNGDVQIKSRPNEGTTVSLYLPRSSTPLQTELQRAPNGGVSEGQGQSILVLEDDADVRAYLLRLLSSFGYEASPAANAALARSLLDRGARFDLLVSDIMLPGGVGGPEFAEEFLIRCPDARVILMSGHPSELNREQTVLENVPILAKPFAPDVLRASIMKALRRLS